MAGESNSMTIHLKIWKQDGPNAKGSFVDHTSNAITSDMSFLEMMDVVNAELMSKGERAIEFDHDCREGICGACSMVINGEPHGPQKETTTCQLHMRSFKNGETIYIEPFRAKAFPIIRDLVVDRSAFDRIIQAGGYVSVNTGSAQDANNIPVPKENADRAFAAAACIGCGACVAACKNASASLFVGAKVAHFNLLPQGQVEHGKRVQKMVGQMDEEQFGACTNTGACSAACPKDISLEHIAHLQVEFLKNSVKSRD